MSETYQRSTTHYTLESLRMLLVLRACTPMQLPQFLNLPAENALFSILSDAATAVNEVPTLSIVLRVTGAKLSERGSFTMIWWKYAKGGANI